MKTCIYGKLRLQVNEHSPLSFISIVAFTGVIGLTACTVAPGVGTTVRVLCAFADVLVRETDLPAAKQAFGEDQLGSKICKAAGILLTGDGEQSPAGVTGTTTADLPLPNGQIIPVQISPSSK